jgi:hypothetical protein
MAQNEQAKSIVIAKPGIRNTRDVIAMMSSLISDLAASRVTPKVANSICEAAGKMLKIAELQHRFVLEDAHGRKMLNSAGDSTGRTDHREGSAERFPASTRPRTQAKGLSTKAR